MIRIKNKLVIIVFILLSLTVYTIYGGIIDNEEIEIKNTIDGIFNTIKRDLGQREIDIVAKENIRYKINNIDIINNFATVDLELTGIDLAPSFYEIDMFQAFYREFLLYSEQLFTEPIVDSYEVYIYIFNNNIGYTLINDLKLQLNKSDGIWKVENVDEVYRNLQQSSVPLETIINKAYENLEKTKEMMTEKYLQEQPSDKTFEEYWENYLYDFITEGRYLTQFPFEEQQFITNTESNLK